MPAVVDFLRHFWPTKVRHQLIVGVALVHLLLMTIFVFDLVGRQHAFLKQESRAQTDSLARTLAVNSTSWVLAGDGVGLQEVVSSLRLYPSLRYAMVVSPDGTVLAHTDASHVGQRLTDPTSQTLGGAAPSLRLLYADDHGIDVAAPILVGSGKLIGWARIGQNQEDIARSLRLVTRNGVLYMLLAIVAGSILALLIGRRLTAELDRLLSVSAQIRDGRRDLRMDASRTEEVARLGAGLNEMLDEIAASEGARHQTLNLLENVLHASPDWIFVKDRDRRMVHCNEAFAAALGKTPAEVVGQDDLALGWPPELVQGDPARGLRGFEADDRAALRGETVRAEAERITLGGQSRYFDTIKVPLRDDTGQIVGLLGLSRDVSERRSHVAQIERLGRLYAALSEINQTIVRVQSQEELFTAICRVLVEISRFKMAWIGWRDPATLAVRPIAMFGDTSGYLDSIQVRADNSSSGRGPTGIAIREARTYVCNEFAADPLTAPWRETAARHGIGASISLPVRLGGEVVGAVTVYAAEKNSFGQQEIALLEEAASDISFALDNFARDARRRLAEEAAKRAAAYNRTLIEASLDALVTIGPDGRITDVSAATEAATGRTRAELIGTDFCDYFTDPPKARAGYQQVFREGAIRDYPLELQHRDGRVFSALYNASVFRDERGEVAGIFASARDITERKQREEQLNLLNTALLAAPNCIVITDARGTIEWVNPAFTRYTGYTAAEAIGQNPRILKSGRQPQAFYTELWRTITSGRNWQGELINRRKDGSLYAENATIAPVRDASGTIRHFVAVKLDITARKEAEEGLRESQALYHSLVEHVPAGVFRKDAAGRYVFVNARYCRIHGGPPEHFLGRTATEVAADLEKLSSAKPEWQEPIRQTYGGADHHKSIMESGQTIELEEEWCLADGSRCYFQVVKTPVFDSAGNVIGSQGILLDITERKRASESLRQRDLELEEAQRIALLGSWRLDAATHAIAWTEGVYRMLDLDPAQPPPSYVELQKFFVPESWQRLSAAMTRTLEQGLPYELELEIIRRDGGRGWMLARGEPVRDSVGAMVGLRGVAQDITARREAERRIREQADLIDKAKEAIIASDLQVRITSWSRGAERLLGWSAAEMIGRPVTEMLANTGVTDAGLYAALATTADWRGEVRGHDRQGRALTAEVSITMLRDDTGQPSGRLGIISDITEKKALEEKFLRSQRLESIGMLAAGIAHDLNNVLAPISMGAPLLRATATSLADVRLLETLEHCAERGAGLARQILGFAQGVTGEPRLVQVKHLLRDIVSVINQTFPKSITIEDRVPSSLWPIMANPTQIHQVLLNLCVNARDAMPNGGILRVQGENCVLDEAAAARLEGARPGAWLILHIEDTGTGIAPEVLPRIWDPFFSTKPIDKGTGLGLPTVRGIVETHHGFITLATAPGCGTTFRVYLPAAESEPGGGGHRAAARARRGHGELILVVDDENLIRETLKATLTAHGYRVITANDGVQGIKLFSAHAGEIALVITDLDMPNLDGGGLGRLIRVQRPATKILVMSGLTDDSRTKAFRYTEFASGFLRKPFTIEELTAAVEVQLSPAAPAP